MAATLLSQHIEKNNHSQMEVSKIQFSTTDTAGTITTGMHRVFGYSIGVFHDASHDDSVVLNESAHTVNGNIEVSNSQFVIVRNGSAQTSGLILQLTVFGY